MSTFDEEAYKPLYDLFNREAKRVEVYKSRPLTENLPLRDEYKKALVETYNNLVDFLTDSISGLQLEESLIIRSKAAANLQRLKNLFAILQLNYPFEKDNLQHIDINNITQSQSDTYSDSNDSIKETNAQISETSTSKDNESQIEQTIDNSTQTKQINPQNISQSTDL